jgi:hypothetical protein
MISSTLRPLISDGICTWAAACCWLVAGAEEVAALAAAGAADEAGVEPNAGAEEVAGVEVAPNRPPVDAAGAAEVAADGAEEAATDVGKLKPAEDDGAEDAGCRAVPGAERED